MKLFDKFLKKLKTSRNTFFTYILTLLSIYILVDRIVELLFLFFTGVSVSYWGPIKYTLALACPVFAFLFSGSSEFVDSKNIKLTFAYIYIISLYIVGTSMVVQWMNQLIWLFLMSVPNYVEIATNFSDLIHPALTSLAIYLPLTTFYLVFKFIVLKVDDTKAFKDSIKDFGGINLTKNTTGTGPYSLEVGICKDIASGKMVKIPENRRFESTLVIGVSGSGKTSMIFEPMIAKDLEKKYFFREISKEMGYTALKTGLARLNCPYDNDYLNNNFNLNMLTPTVGKEKLYRTYFRKMLVNESNPDDFTYRNVGLTAISPDYESTRHIIDVANNLNINVNVIDPENPSVGINPFIFEDPTKIAIAISSVLKGMYFTNNVTPEESFMENVANQAIENLTILLKEMYPRLNGGKLPNIEDMLNMLNDFDIVEDMCKTLEIDPELASKYRLQLGYFKKHFYKTGSARQDTEKYVYSAATQLDTLLRIEGVRNILCNRVNNLNFDKVLEEGEITLVCTRRGDLGANAHRAFGLFFLLLMQYSILRRPGNEQNRIPHFLYIDEFPTFICNATSSIFTLYRKYRVGTIISAQNLDQLGNKNTSKFRQTILSNCTNKIVFGNNTPEDNEWWSLEFGNKREWKFGRDYHSDGNKNADGLPGYDENYKSIEWAWKRNAAPNKIQSLKFKQCYYKTKDTSGKTIVGDATVDFLESKYKEPRKSKQYNFSKFSNGIFEGEIPDKKEKFNPSNVDFSKLDARGDVDPIQSNTSDNSFFLNNDDAIIFDLKNNKKN